MQTGELSGTMVIRMTIDEFIASSMFAALLVIVIVLIIYVFKLKSLEEKMGELEEKLNGKINIDSVRDKTISALKTQIDQTERKNSNILNFASMKESTGNHAKKEEEK